MMKDAHNPLDDYERYSGEEWARWDEDLVKDFGHWLALVAKAFALVIFLGALTRLGFWLWTWF